ncbi:copper-binding protein [Phenylobacterium sp. 58.2.17]|jgi:Cu(I)/Ag(I) efflux system periplasmic protein CusF|uniref:copper-binding protein n=1 Tax=Phenylobacterium sp. 58.2.17 TaxID=2969306 RepID=UPI000B14424F|nr:copper-binding protein [Phenylobacterium sp. 58.2.17]MCX7586291.1 copper-binding protein [Phenylobacterium sp. 58.2.17]
MKRTTLTLAGLGLAAVLTACSPKTEEKAVETAPPPETPKMAEGMAMDASAAKSVKATGTVTAVDAAAGVITVDHTPIPEANWPAMTMGFKATPALAQSVNVGDKVAFDLTIKDGAGEITAIQKQ